MPLSQMPAFGWQTAKCEYQITPYKEYMSNILHSGFIVTKKGLSKEGVDYHVLSQRYKKYQKEERRKANLFQLAGCVPLLNTVIAVIRIYSKIFELSNEVSNRKNHIFRAVLELTQFTLILLIIDIIVTIYRNKQKELKC